MVSPLHSDPPTQLARVSSSVITELYGTCCEHDTADISLPTEQKIAHLLDIHALEILSTKVKPYFIHQHPALDKRRRRNPDKQPDVEFYENQLWKEASNEDGSAISILQWIILSTNVGIKIVVSLKSNIKTILPEIIPPILTLVDDYEVVYKATGVTLLHHILINIDPITIKKSGLNLVFFEALSKCLTYTTDPETEVPLMISSYPCILYLIQISHPENSESQFAAYETVMLAILNGLKYGGAKLRIRKVLIEQIPAVYEKLHAVGVKYLKHVLPVLCETIELPFSVSSITKRPGIFDLHISSLATLISVMKICWPRIPHYQGIILKSIAVAWKMTADRVLQSGELDSVTQELQSSLLMTIKLLKGICGPQIQADCNALLQLDSSVFEQLVA